MSAQNTRYLPGVGKFTDSMRSWGGGGIAAAGFPVPKRFAGTPAGLSPLYIRFRGSSMKMSSGAGSNRFVPDVTWFSTIAVNDDLVKAGDEKVYGSTCLDCDFVRYELVDVTVSWIVDKV
jgi:hypothetical protein